MRNRFLGVIVLVLASCGGGGGSGGSPSLEVADDTAGMTPPDQDNENQDDSDDSDDSDQSDEQSDVDSPPTAGTDCPNISIDFGGDVVGNEYMQSGQRSALVFGDTVGFNTVSNTEVVREIPLTSCLSIPELEFGKAYVLPTSVSTDSTDISIEVRNKSARFLCGITSTFVTLNDQGVPFVGEFDPTAELPRPQAGLTGIFRSELDGRVATLANQAPEMSEIVQASSCLRPGEVGYFIESERRDRFAGFDGFEDIQGVDIVDLEVSGLAWTEASPLFPIVTGYSIIDTTSPGGSTVPSQTIEFMFAEELNFSEIAGLANNLGVDSISNRFVLLDTFGRPVYHGNFGSGRRISDFQGSSNSIRVMQFVSF